MRKSIRALGTAAALLGMGVSSAAQAQAGCADLRGQYRGIETLAAKPMTLAQLRQLATKMTAIRTDVVLFEPPAGSPPTSSLLVDQTYAIEALKRQAAPLGIGCATSMTALECADSLVAMAAHAVRLADPGGFQAWRIDEALMLASASEDERATRIFAGTVGIACPGQGPCKDYLVRTLKAMQAEADAIQLLDSATDQASGRDAREPLFNLLKNQLLEQMGDLHCGEGPEPPPPVEFARVAPNDFGPPSQSATKRTPAQQVPVGGPVLEMDPARPPEPTPTGGNWTTVSPGQMIYRGTSELGTWSWSEPPQSIGPEGALITLTVSGQVTNGNGWATGIQIRAQGFTLTSPGGIPIDGDLPLNLERNGSGDRQIVVKVTPQDNSVGSNGMILVGAFYGAQVRYYYKVVRSAGN